jgi:inner membrane protein
MRWVSHTLIGASVCAVWQPALTPWAVLGATAPDWLEWLGGAHLPVRRVIHRGLLHNLLAWLLLWAGGWLLDPWGMPVMAFGLGGVLHWLCDAMTVTGAPLTWWSQHRSTLFGGRLRQGSKTERGLAFGVALACAVLWMPRWAAGPQEFSLFWMPWQRHYQSGLIDAAEWRRHRFTPF